MIGRFFSNLGMLLFVLLLVGLCAAALVLTGLFGFSVADHFDGRDPSVYGYHDAPAIHWWLLAAAAGLTLAAVAVWSAVPEGESSYYCPNCDCADCKLLEEFHRG